MTNNEARWDWWLRQTFDIEGDIDERMRGQLNRIASHSFIVLLHYLLLVFMIWVIVLLRPGASRITSALAWLSVIVVLGLVMYNQQQVTRLRLDVIEVPTSDYRHKLISLRWKSAGRGLEMGLLTWGVWGLQSWAHTGGNLWPHLWESEHLLLAGISCVAFTWGRYTNRRARLKRV